MRTIPLQNIPRQKFTITLDGFLFTITLLAIQDCMYATIDRDGINIVKGQRCVSGFQVFPYRYQEGTGGNFAFITTNDALPWWENFGMDQQFVYASASELTGFRI